MPASRFQFDLVANVGRFRRGFRSADRVVRGFGDRLGFLRSRLTQVGGALAAFFGGRALARGFRAIVGEAADLEEAIARIQAVTGAADEDIQRLRETAVELGESTQFTAVQAAGAIENLGRAGLSTSEQLETVPQVLNLATATGRNLGESASFVTQAIKGMGLAFSDSQRVTDVFVEATQNANTDVRKLALGLAKAAPAARAAGVSFEKTVAAVASLQERGIQAEEAGTGLRNIISELDNETSTFSQALDSAGIGTRDLSEVLNILGQGGGRAEQVFNGLTKEVRNTLQALAGLGGEGLEQFTQQLNEVDGATSDAASTMRDTLNNSMEQLGSAWNTLKRAIGQPVLEPVRKTVDRLQTDIANLNDSGHLERIGEAIADSFQKGVKAVRDFLGQFTVEEAVDDAVSSVNKLGDAFTRVNDVISRVANAAGALWNFVQGAVGGAMALIGKLAASAAQRFADLANVMSRLGLVSDETAEKIQMHVNALDHASNETARYANESLQKAWEQSKRVIAATDESAKAHEEAGDAADKHGDKEQEAADQAEQAAATYQELADITEQVGKKLEEDQAAAQQEAVASALRKRADAARQAATDAKSHLDELRKSGTATQKEIFEASKAYQEASTRAARFTESLAQGSSEAKGEAEKLKAAMESLGVETQASLEEAAASAKRAFEQVLQTGSPEEIERAFAAYAEKAIEANGGAANSYVEATAKALGLQEAITGVGDAADESGDKAADSADKAGDAAADSAKQAQRSSEEAISSSRRAAQGLAAIVTALRDKYREVGEGALEAFDELNNKAADGLSTMRGYLNDLASARDRLDQQVARERESLQSMKQTIEASEGSTADLAQIASYTTDQFELLGKEQLSPVRSAIQQAQQDLERMRSSTEGTLDSLQEELLQLQGREDELAERRNENRRRELEGRMAEAQAAGDSQSVQNVREALRTLEKIQTAERQQRRTEQQQSTPSEPQRKQTIELRGPDGGTATVEADEGNAEAFINELEKVGLRTQ